jgi:hypothetical protein
MLYNRRKSVVIVKVTHIDLNYDEKNFSHEKVDIQKLGRRSGSASFIL